MPSAMPRNFRLSQSDLDLIDWLREAMRPEPGVEVSRSDVLRAGVRKLAGQYGHPSARPPKNNRKKSVPTP